MGGKGSGKKDGGPGRKKLAPGAEKKPLSLRVSGATMDKIARYRVTESDGELMSTTEAIERMLAPYPPK